MIIIIVDDDDWWSSFFLLILFFSHRKIVIHTHWYIKTIFINGTSHWSIIIINNKNQLCTRFLFFSMFNFFIVSLKKKINRFGQSFIFFIIIIIIWSTKINRDSYRNSIIFFFWKWPFDFYNSQITSTSTNILPFLSTTTTTTCIKSGHSLLMIDRLIDWLIDRYDQYLE